MSRPESRFVHLVDDDAGVRRAVSFMLKTAGHRVESYENGTELLNKIGALEDGCILLDIRMPGMDGLEVQHALQQKGVALPVIMMTGHGDVSLAVKAMKAGAVDFVEKPPKREALLASLEEGFGRIAKQETRDDQRQGAVLRLQALSARERNVLEGLAQGLPNKSIAYDLGISPRTVEIHRANLMAKLQARSLSEALRIAFQAMSD